MGNIITASDNSVTAAADLDLPENLSFSEWSDLGRRLLKAHTRTQWQLGEWWLRGRRFDSRRESLLEEWGVQRHTVENYAWVCNVFRDISRRREQLSFGHHEAVAKMGADEAGQLLDWCLEDVEANGRPRSRTELRREVYLRKRMQAFQRSGVQGSPDEPSISAWVVWRPSMPPESPDDSSPPYVSRSRAALAESPDDSTGGDPFPAPRAAPSVEPLPPRDRIVAMAKAKAAIEAVSAEELVSVIKKLPQGKRPEVFQAAIEALSAEELARVIGRLSEGKREVIRSAAVVYYH
jgi:hypothetical protein